MSSNNTGLYDCVCNNCGNTWDPFETEHFNISFCYACLSGDVDTVDDEEDYNEEEEDE